MIFRMFLVSTQAEAAFPLSYLRKPPQKSLEPPGAGPGRASQTLSSQYSVGILHPVASTQGWWTVALGQAVCPACARVCLLSKALAGSCDSGGRNLLITHWGKASLELLRAQFLTLPLVSLVTKLKSEGRATTIHSLSVFCLGSSS